MILTKPSKRDFESILSNYDIGKYKSHEHIPYALANTVFLIRTTKGKFILKIFEGQNLNSIKYQIKLINALQKKIPVPENILSRDNKIISQYKNKPFVIQKYIEGIHPRKYNNELTKDLAKNIIAMHKIFLKLKFRGGDIGWGKDHQFKRRKLIPKIDKFPLQKHCDKLIEEIKTINRKKLKRSIIHADLVKDNLLVKKNKLTAILDFDDSHRDYLVHDIAVFLARAFVYKNKIDKKRLKLFLKKYQKEIKINNEEKKAIYYFTKYRMLGSISYAAKQRKKHRKIGISKWMKRKIKEYITFNKLPLEEFLSLF